MLDDFLFYTPAELPRLDAHAVIGLTPLLNTETTRELHPGAWNTFMHDLTEGRTDDDTRRISRRFIDLFQEVIRGFRERSGTLGSSTSVRALSLLADRLARRRAEQLALHNRYLSAYADAPKHLAKQCDELMRRSIVPHEYLLGPVKRVQEVENLLKQNDIPGRAWLIQPEFLSDVSVLGFERTVQLPGNDRQHSIDFDFDIKTGDMTDIDGLLTLLNILEKARGKR